MSQTKVVKGKARQEKPLRVMHRVENGTITSRTVDPKALREAVGPDKVQQAEETGHKLPPLPKAPKASKPKPKKEVKVPEVMSELDHKILKALDALGGKDVASIDIAKHAGTTRTHADAPRQPVRAAMQRFEKLGYVKSERKAVKYLFSITEKGKHFLSQPPEKSKDSKDKGANPAPVLSASSSSNLQAHSTPAAETRPANTDRQCGTCRTWNPFGADFCKQCGKPMKAAPVVVAA